MATQRRWFKIGSGIAVGVSSIVGLFLLLISQYNFEISDLTGNIVCAGTIEDPCISEFSVKNTNPYNVDVYSNDTISLEFIPKIKDYALFVQDGRCGATGSCACSLRDGTSLGYKGWRCTDFTNKTKPREDKAYVFRFASYSTTKFRLVGLKNKPEDSIKWTFDSSKGELDPWWNGFYLNTTTQTDSTIVLNYKFDNDTFKGESYTAANNLIYDYAGKLNATSYGNMTYRPTGGINGSGAFHFDGVNDNITRATNIGRFNNLTICVWYNSSSTASTNRDIITSWGTAGGYILRLYSDDILYYVRNSSGALDNIGSTAKQASTVVVNKWGLICVRRNSDMNFSLFHNGVHFASKVNISGQVGNANYIVSIGNVNTGGNNFNGTLDDITFWNRSLSDQEIANLYGDECNPLIGEDWYIMNKSCVWSQNMDNPSKTLYILNKYNVTLTDNANLTIQRVVINNGSKLIKLDGSKIILNLCKVLLNNINLNLLTKIG